MSKLNQVRNFVRSLKSKAVAARGLGAIAFAVGSSALVIYSNHSEYWKVTIFRTQSVDFNILAKLLPARISQDLLSGNIQDLQENLDSNYGLFGMIITDCKTTEKSCPNQRIQYGSQLSISQDQGQTKIESRNDYTDSWLYKLTQPEKLQSNLEQEVFIPLYNPPKEQQLLRFPTPRSPEPEFSDFNTGEEVIGRLYFVRADQPSPIDELIKWLSNPLQNSTRNRTYGTILAAALLASILTWLVAEFCYYLYVEESKKRLKAEKDQSKILSEKSDLDDQLRDALEKEFAAWVERQAAVEDLDSAISQINNLQRDSDLYVEELEIALQAKEEAEQRAKAIEDKQDAIQQDKEALSRKIEVLAKELEQVRQAREAAENIVQALQNESVRNGSRWQVEFTRHFIGQVTQIDRTLQGRILAVLAELSESPLDLRGDSIKVLSSPLRGKRRYRLGDYRLVFDVNRTESKVVLIAFGSRASVYDSIPKEYQD